MSSGALSEIFRALDDADARYLVVGGVAVVLHGHPRFTDLRSLKQRSGRPKDLDDIEKLDQIARGRSLQATTRTSLRELSERFPSSFAMRRAAGVG